MALLGWLLAMVLVLAWRALPRPGPVLFYDLVRTTRRGRHIPFRCLYAFALLFALFLLYASWFPTRLGWDLFFREVTLDQHQLSRFGESFANAYLIVQLGVVLVRTPAVAAGAIAEERESQTLDFLYLSELTSGEIVLGKLVSRLSRLSLLLLTGLPILGLTQLWGGVDIGRLLAGFAAAFATMFGLGSLGLVCSVHSRRVLTAVACTYLLAIPLAIGLGCVGGCCLPFLQVATDIGVNFVLGSLAAVETMLGLVCCWLATAEIAAQRQAPWPPRRQPSAGWGYVEISSETLPGPDRSDPVPTRPPDSLVHWTQARLGRWLGTRPLLWKEVPAKAGPFASQRGSAGSY